MSGGPLEDQFELAQFHCHWGQTDAEGSEHTIEGKSFAGEIHLVHWNKKYGTIAEAVKYPDGLCVLGIFLQPGSEHQEVEKIVELLKKVEYKDQKAKIQVPIDPEKFIPEKTSFFTYNGSLTTPPCSECVIWIVFQEPIQVSSRQLEAFRKLKAFNSPNECTDPNECVKQNYRPTLPLGDRHVIHFRE